jgi:hypothetical protein
VSTAGTIQIVYVIQITDVIRARRLRWSCDYQD